MARLLISAAGAAAGFAIGGPVGAQWGWTFGSIAGALLAPPQGPEGQDTIGPRLNDREVTTSTYGIMRPIIYGTIHVPGNIIDASILYETTHVVESDSGGGKGGGGETSTHTTFTYSMDLAVGLGVGPRKLVQFFANEKLLYDATPGATVRQPEWLNLKFYPGDETQMPDSVLEAIHGVGNVPGYRGESFIRIEKMELAEFGNRPPTFKIISTSSGTESVSPVSIDLGTPASGKSTNQVSCVVYDDRTGLLWVTLVRDWRDHGPEEHHFAIEPYSKTIIHRKSTDFDELGYHFYSFNNLEIGGYERYFQGGFVILEPVVFSLGRASDATGNRNLVIYQAESGEILKYRNLNRSKDSNARIVSCYTERIVIYQFTYFYGLVGYEFTNNLVNDVAWRITPPEGWDPWNGIMAAKKGKDSGAILAFSIKNTADSDIVGVGIFEENAGAGLREPYPSFPFYSPEIVIVQLPTGSAAPKEIIYDETSDCFWALEDGNVSILDDGSPLGRNRFHKISPEGVLLSSHDFWVDYGIGGLTITGDARPNFYRDPLSNDLWFATNEGAYQWDTNTLEAPTTYTLGEGGTINWLHSPSDAVVHGEHGTTTIDAKIWVSTLYAVTEDVIYLEEVVEDICSKPGLQSSEYSASSLSAIPVPGYRILNIMTARGALEPLRHSYLFDSSEDGEKINFVLRGGSSSRTLTVNDLGARPGGSAMVPTISKTREHEPALPRTLYLNYINPDDNYENGTQYATRLAGHAGTKITLNLSVVMDDDTAAQLADVLLHLMHIERIGATMSAMPVHYDLLPSNIITSDVDSKQLLLRLTKVGYNQGVVKLLGTRDDPSVYTSYLQGVSNDARNPTIKIAGLTLVFLLDIPMLDQGHDDAGFYAPATSFTPNWPGCVLFKSNDGSTYGQIGGMVNQVTAGYVQSDINDIANPWVWDTDNVLAISMISGTLESVTEEQCLTEVNAAVWGAPGRWELIIFQYGVLQANGSFLVSKLGRGLRGTDWAVNLHESGDTFILISANSFYRFAEEVTEVGTTDYFKAVTVGKNITTATVKRLKHTGEALMPWPPVLPAASWSGNDITTTFVRRGRFPVIPFWTPTLSEATEAYEMDVLDTDEITVKRILTSSTESFLYESADQITDFGVNQDLIRFNIYQMSDAVGRGHALAGILNK